MSKENKELYEFGNFRLDVGERRLERLNGNPANGPLREKPFEVLVHLVRKHGRLVSKDELISAAWPDAIVEEANLSKAIHAIRQFLGETVGEQKYIETVPKHGYRFVADVISYIDRLTADKPAISRARITESGAHAVVSLAEWQEIVSRTEEGMRASVRSTATFNTNDEHAVKNRSEPGLMSDPVDRSETPVSAEPIPHSKSNTSVGSSVPRKTFRVAAVILIGAIGFGGLLVANWLQGETLPESSSLINAESHSRAYDLYVRGKVKAGIENREETEAAIKLLEEAVMLDPNLAEAYAQLARVYNTRAFKFAPDTEQKQFYENAEVAIQKAFELNSDLAEAHFARGLILWNNTKGFPHEQAIRSYKRSLELDSRQDETHHQLSMVYAHIGLMDEARASLNKTLALNPNNTMARFRAGNYLAWQGRFEEALAVLKTVPSDVSPLLVERIKAETLIQIGSIDEAQIIVDDYLNRYPNDEGGSFTSVNAVLLARAGKREEAENAIRHASETGKGFGHFHHTAYNIASAYAIMNNPDEAVKWLENAADNGFPNFPYFQVDPNLNGIRKDQTFIDLMAKLSRQWERFKTEI